MENERSKQVPVGTGQSKEPKLNLPDLEKEVRARIGNKEIILLDVKKRICRLAMTAKSFRAFKVKAGSDDILRFFEFSHRNPKTQRRMEEGYRPEKKGEGKGGKR
jgi:hypothetical protein